MRILFIGDIVGSQGRKAVKSIVPALKKEKQIDFCIANGENLAAGTGITFQTAQDIFSGGVDLITLGNHTWAKKEAISFIESDPRVIRPANYPAGTPGLGFTVLRGEAGSVGVVNLLGRVYMEPMDCPFKTADQAVEELKKSVKVVVVDMHAEATSEKCALAWHLDGRVSCVLGTHTHVQTADERIFERGTGYISDVGMTGPYESVIGVDSEIAVERFVRRIPIRYEVAKGSRVQFNAVLIDVDEKTGKTVGIERIFTLIEI